MSVTILSILVISHNQRALLPRCINSILNQIISVHYEIIISDDRSTDGTWELSQEYATKYPQIVPVKCNSDECNPVSRAERCGWNKLNAWRYARGKYMVNIDADDYLKSSDIYQKQIEALEKHPECSMCMQRAVSLNDGDSLEHGNIWPKHPMLQDYAIITPREFLLNDLRGLNQTYMMRRYVKDDMVKLYGKLYDDTVITLHNLQYGNVIFIDKSDYIWVQYPNSISHSLSKYDELVCYSLLPIHHIQLIPKLFDILMESGIKGIIHLLKQVPSPNQLSNQVLLELQQKDGFIYKYVTEIHHNLFTQFRFNICRYFILISRKCRLQNHLMYLIIYKILVGKVPDLSK